MLCDPTLPEAPPLEAETKPLTPEPLELLLLFEAETNPFIAPPPPDVLEPARCEGGV